VFNRINNWLLWMRFLNQYFEKIETIDRYYYQQSHFLNLIIILIFRLIFYFWWITNWSFGWINWFLYTIRISLGRFIIFNSKRLLIVRRIWLLLKSFVQLLLRTVQSFYIWEVKIHSILALVLSKLIFVYFIFYLYG
jgi:hypothetical protein